MDRNLLSKRKLEDVGALQSHAKSQKLADEDEEHPYAFTKLPPEILLDIFDYLKPKDDCMKELSLVCKKFYNLCSPKLRVLQVDLNKIVKRSCNPVIKRAYTEIRIICAEWICSKKVRQKRDNIGNFLQSSKPTARKLVIKETDKSLARCVVKIRILKSIIQSMPNLTEVEINNVNGLMPDNGPYKRKRKKSKTEPTLPNLRKLTLTNVLGMFCLPFDRAENIEELKLKITSLNEHYQLNSYQLLLKQQSKLKLLHLDLQNFSKKVINVIGNKRFTDAALGGNDIESLLARYPKLEHIKLRPRQSTITRALLTAGPPVTTLKTIELLGNRTKRFDIKQIRKKFPSLKSFKSSNLNWSITSDLQSY